MACNSKRKVTLTLLKKRQIIEKLDAGVANSVILRDYKIGRSTLFYIKKKKQEILKAAPFTSNKRHSLDPNVNNQEHSDGAISWDDAEKSMETVIRFLEKSPYFYNRKEVTEPKNCRFLRSLMEYNGSAQELN